MKTTTEMQDGMKDKVLEKFQEWINANRDEFFNNLTQGNDYYIFYDVEDDEVISMFHAGDNWSFQTPREHIKLFHKHSYELDMNTSELEEEREGFEEDAKTAGFEANNIVALYFFSLYQNAPFEDFLEELNAAQDIEEKIEEILSERAKKVTEKITGYKNDIVVIQKCNHCGRFETAKELRARNLDEGEEAGWIEGQVENGLSTDERIEAREILNEAFENEGFEATEDDAEEQNWDVCFNVCPECASEKTAMKFKDIAGIENEYEDEDGVLDEDMKNKIKNGELLLVYFGAWDGTPESNRRMELTTKFCEDNEFPYIYEKGSSDSQTAIMTKEDYAHLEKYIEEHYDDDDEENEQ